MRALESVSAAVVVVALAAHAGAQSCPSEPSHIVVESGTYSPQPGAVFRLRHFDATLTPMGRKAPACLSHWTDMAHGEIFVSNESVTEVFAGKLSATQSNLRDLKIVHGAGTVTISGVMQKAIPVKFSIEGPVSTDGAIISMTAEKIDADGIPIKPLLALIGKHLSSVLGFQGISGVQVKGNVMSFSPDKVAHLRGYLVAAEATPEGLTLRYGRRPRAHAVAKVAKAVPAPS